MLILICSEQILLQLGIVFDKLNRVDSKSFTEKEISQKSDHSGSSFLNTEHFPIIHIFADSRMGHLYSKII